MGSLDVTTGRLLVSDLVKNSVCLVGAGEWLKRGSAEVERMSLDNYF